MKKQPSFRKAHNISIAIGLIAVLIVVSISLSFYNRRVMERTRTLQAQTKQIKFLGAEVFHNTIRNIDVSVRGYAVMQEERFLFFPPAEARKNDERILASLDSLLKIQHYPDSLNNLGEVKASISEYIDRYEQMVTAIQQGRMDDLKDCSGKTRG